jgi:voltage-gated potassium channel
MAPFPVPRPTVVTFLDRMLRDRDTSFRVEELQVKAGSALAGKRLRDASLAQRGVLVMAIQPPGSEQFVYVPSPEVVLEAGCVVVVLGSAEQMSQLRAEV